MKVDVVDSHKSDVDISSGTPGAESIDFDSIAEEMNIDDTLAAHGVTGRHKGTSSTDAGETGSRLPRTGMEAKAKPEPAQAEEQSDEALPTGSAPKAKPEAQPTGDPATGDQAPVEQSGEPRVDPTYPTRRNYEQFPAEQRAHLKKMSNAQFAYAEKLLLDSTKASAELADLKKAVGDSGVPLNWYSHPNAYQLHPQYAAEANKLAEYQVAQQHWQDQLIAMEEGEKVYTLARDEQGNLIRGAEVENTPRNKAQIYAAMQKAAAGIERYQSNLELMRGSFNERYQRSGQFLRNTAKAEIAKLPESVRPQADFIKRVREALPPEVEPNAAETIAELYAVCTTLNNALVAALQKQSQAQVLAQDQRAAGGAPRKVVPPRGGAAPKADEIDFGQLLSEFNQRE